FSSVVLVLAFVVGGLAQNPPVGQYSQGDDRVDSTGPASAFALGGTATGPESAPVVGAAGELIGFSGISGSGSHTITLVHAGKMQMAVYHIDGTGKIRLVSSRPLDADFSVMLNATKPLPGEIRLLGGEIK
ncbi:MAG: hypothetical protein AAFU85_32840, partial [Planctomycetota bacterium]